MMLGLLRRAFGLVCLLLVAWAAVSVPVGRRTAWGHLVAIFTTEPARQAAEDIEGIAIGSLRGGKRPGSGADVDDKIKATTEPSQGPAPRGKTPAPGSTHVRSAQQGVPAGS
jgi:hypothetical protein